MNRCQRLGVGRGDGGSNSTLVDRHCLSASSPSLSRSKSALRSRLCANQSASRVHTPRHNAIELASR